MIEGDPPKKVKRVYDPEDEDIDDLMTEMVEQGIIEVKDNMVNVISIKAGGKK